MLIPQQPRVSCTYKIGGTLTFRLSSSMIFETYGRNLQNVEKPIRALILADPGYIILPTDQAGAEALIVAYLCKAGNYRRLFELRIKPHTFVALHVFADEWMRRYESRRDVSDALSCRTIDELASFPGWKKLAKFIASSDNWNSNERFYYLGKKIVHASSYSMGVKTFITSVLSETEGEIALSKQKATQYLEKFHSLFPEIRQWHFSIQREYRETKCLRNLFGYPYYVTDFIGDQDWGDLYSFKPQSTVGVLTSIAYTQMQDYIESNRLDWHMLNNNHDSFIPEVPDNPDDIKHCVEKSREFIEKDFVSPVDGIKFKMRSETLMGYNWGPHHEKKN